MNRKKGKITHIVASLGLVLAYVTFSSITLAQQGGQTLYVYDDKGRLRAVVAPSGEAAVYDYDAAGNFTAIRRLAATALELLDFFPKQGVPGDLVTFIGVGFGAGVNSVSFNGAAAQVGEVTNTTVVATVPPGATTGLVTIVTPRGMVTTAQPFTIRGVRVDPASVRLLPGAQVQFTATVVAGGNQSVAWSVNDIDGGNPMVGTISATGLYTAPNQPNQPPGSAIVRATSLADPSLFGEAVVTIQDAGLVIVALSPLVSVRRGLAMGMDPTRPAYSAGVSVRRGLALGMDPTRPTYSAGVSVRRGLALGMDPTRPTYSPDVSVTIWPHIASITPTQIARGATLTLTISGANLSGATGISFYDDNGVLDANITVSNLTVNGDGTILTASVTVNNSAALGQRLVIVLTPTRRSQTSYTGTNTVQVIQ